MKKKIYLKGHINEKKFKVDITPPIPSPYLKRFIPPHQEGWRKDFDKKFVAITQGTKRCWWVDNPDRVIAYIEELLLSTHSADIAAFRGMIGKNEEDDSYLGETEHEEIHRKVRNAFRHELREKVKGGRYDHNY